MKTPTLEHLPVAVIGGGPVGLAAAAHLIARGLPVKLYEAGPAVGANLRDWGHVRVFTPWRYCLDAAATALLDRHGWRAPAADAFPTGAELVSAYLEPLAQTPELAAVLQTNARVTAISRHGIDKVVSRGARSAPLRPGGRRRRMAFAATWRARSSTPREHGRRRIRSARAACRRPAKRNFAIGSPTAFPIFSAAIAILYAGARRSSSAPATRPAMRCSNSRHSRKSIRARRFSGRREAPISRAFSAAAMPTSCRRAANSARMCGSLSIAGA